MIIQRGKTDGWLRLGFDAVKLWAEGAGIRFSGASPGLFPRRGMVLLANHDIAPTSSSTSHRSELLSVPEELVLSADAVKHHAQFDKDFREVLDSLGDFGRSPRGAILIFLLFQASISDPTNSEKFGVHSAFTDYVKTLPCELLPTFWTPDELALLSGTTLAPAVSSKLRSLHREYDLLCTSCSSTRWFRIVESHLDFDDWLQVDAMFRSRALEFHGSCMIPGIDLASHAAGEKTNAFYDRTEGLYHLYAVEGQTIDKTEEICITYGDEKGACEMVFSYGFIDFDMDTAETLFLSLGLPPDDPARRAKLGLAQCAPGFKLIHRSREDGSRTSEAMNPVASDEGTQEESKRAIDWTGDFIWLLCVDESDGFRAQVAVNTNGEEEIEAVFGSHVIEGGAAGLCKLLAQSDFWDVYQLRAIVILQQRIFDQLQILYTSQEEIESTPNRDDNPVRAGPFETAMKLRKLEFDLLNTAYENFERQKLALAESPVVKTYLQNISKGGAGEDDFS